ncbi:type III-B CRISPR module-associated protein Cmr5 [Arhodomonas sp. AD133]|uniref:type III-B CRISPR module-associated protein Cmr5 n=1 Tax=Arhodomonas sp. AD133 TaxID=3415009 RepID=UPI003EC0B7D3
MTMSLEQRRAADAWSVCEDCDKSFVALAKGVPALIMNSGLMQTLAFLESKGEAHHKDLARRLRLWLVGQFPDRFAANPSRSSDPGYAAFMEALMNAEPREFQALTGEAMAWLRWVRQIAPTRQTQES